MNMNKRDLKKLTKSQLIKLLLKQEKNGQVQKQIANEFENSIVSLPKQEESFPRGALMVTKTLLSNHHNNSEIDKDLQNPPENHQYLHHQTTISISTMTCFKPKTQVLENSKSLVYKADKIKTSNLLQMNSKLRS